MQTPFSDLLSANTLNNKNSNFVSRHQTIMPPNIRSCAGMKKSNNAIVRENVPLFGWTSANLMRCEKMERLHIFWGQLFKIPHAEDYWGSDVNGLSNVCID